MSGDETNPWRRLSSRQIYENPWFTLRDDKVIRPDAKDGSYQVIVAKNLAIGVVPLWDDGSITLVGQFRYALDEYSWEIPEGGGDPAVDPVDSARRELKEETGIVADHYESLGRTHTSNCFMNETGYLYLATGLTQGEACPDPEEVLQVRRVLLEEAIAMANDGRITDAMTIVALFRTQQRSKEL